MANVNCQALVKINRSGLFQTINIVPLLGLEQQHDELQVTSSAGLEPDASSRACL